MRTIFLCVLIVLSICDTNAQDCEFGCDRAKSFDHPIFDCDLNFVLEFEDNFNGIELNETTWWAHREGTSQAPFSSLVHYSQPENIEVSYGTMKIHAKNETVSGVKRVDWLDETTIMDDGLPNGPRTYEYTTGSIQSRKSYSYGIYEAKIKLPQNGDAYWPAFWTYGEPVKIVPPPSPSEDPEDGTPKPGIWNEIDIIDNNEGTNKLVSAIMYDYNKDGYKKGSVDGEECRTDKTKNNLGDWHVYECIWTPIVIKMYFDGELIYKRYYMRDLFWEGACKFIDCSIYGDEQEYWLLKAFPQDPMDIRLSVVVKSDVSNTTFPDAMEVDYVKYYRAYDKCEDLHANVPFDLDLYEVPGFTSIIEKENVLIDGVAIDELSNLDLSANSIELLPTTHIEPRKHDVETYEQNYNGDGQVRLRSANIACSDSKAHSPNDSIRYMHEFSDEQESVSSSSEQEVWSFELYPNPAQTESLILFSKEITGTLEIINTLGVVTKSITLRNQKEVRLNISDYSDGVHFVKANDHGSGTSMVVPLQVLK